MLKKKKIRRTPFTVLFFFFLQRYSPFTLALASLIIDAHSSLSNAFVLHFTLSFLKSPSTSFIHLCLGHPQPFLPSNFPSQIFTDLVLFILITCPSHSNLLIFISHSILGFIFGYQFCISFNSPIFRLEFSEKYVSTVCLNFLLDFASNSSDGELRKKCLCSWKCI